MFGPTEWILSVAVFSSMIAVGTDFTLGKIYNWLTLPILLLGIAFHGFSQGFEGVVFSLFGVLIAFAVLIAFYLFRVLGAGDVKFMMALGAWMGMDLILQAIALSFIVGAFYSVLALITKGSFNAFLRSIYVFIFTLFAKGIKAQVPEFKEPTKVPFALPLAVGVIWTLISQPLKGVIF